MQFFIFPAQLPHLPSARFEPLVCLKWSENLDFCHLRFEFSNFSSFHSFPLLQLT